MSPIHALPLTRESLTYLQEENALLKDAAIEARAHLRDVADTFDFLITKYRTDAPMTACLLSLRKSTSL